MKMQLLQETKTRSFVLGIDAAPILHRENALGSSKHDKRVTIPPMLM